MPSPIERTSRGYLNGSVRVAVLPGQRMRSVPGFALVARPEPRLIGYDWTELSERVDVSIATLRHWVRSGYFRPRGAGAGSGDGNRDGGMVGGHPGGAGFAAVDVVRLEVLVRLVRSGVPVARAAELVSTSE